MDINPVRGEAKVKVGPVEITMAATMERLAQLSDAVGNPPLHDLYGRLYGMEQSATRAGIRVLTTGGEMNGEKLKAAAAVHAALAALSLADMPALQAGFIAILATLTREPAEDGDPGKEQRAALN